MEENLETSTVETTDNSPSLEDEINQAFDEPSESTDEPAVEETEEVGTKEQTDNTQDVPDKFKGKDGSIDVNNLLKSYKELESYSSQEKAKWQEERAELLKAKEELDKQAQQREDQAKQQGFESALDMQQQYELIQLEANEYAKYLQYTDDPEQVRDMLIGYINNPTKQALEDIELEFSPDVIKRVAIAKEQQRMQFANQRQTQLETQRLSGIEQIISDSVDKNRDIFNYKPFENLFTSCLQRYGSDFNQEDADVLMNAAVELKEAFRQEFIKEYGLKEENKKATDKIAGLSNTKSAPVSSEPDMSKMTQKELEKYIETLL